MAGEGESRFDRLAHVISDFRHDFANNIRDVQTEDYFEDWTVDELKEVLAINGIEVYNANLLCHSDLCEIIRAEFGTISPGRPPPVSEEEYQIRVWAAKTIQRAFFNMKRRKYGALIRQRLQEEAKQEVLLWNQNRDDDDQTRRLRGRSSVASPRSNATDAPWIPPSKDQSREAASKIHPRKGDGLPFDIEKATTGRYCILGSCGEQIDYWREGQISEFSPFGSGISNYFKFIKWCGWTMFTLFLVSLPMMIINYQAGLYVSGDNIDSLSRLSLGNLGNVTSINVPFCNSGGYNVGSCTVGQSRIGIWYGWIDAFFIFVLSVAYFWMRHFLKEEEDFIERNVWTVSRYTVYLPWVPPDTRDVELRAHFARVTNETVAAVSIGVDNATEIEFFKKRGRFTREKKVVTETIKYIKTNQITDRYPELDKLEEKRQALQEKISEINKITRRLEVESKTVCAYVTFENESGMMQGLKHYYNSWFRYIFMDRRLYFKGYRLKARPAPQPSTILWENLKFTANQRRMRSLFTAFISILFLIFSVFVNFFAINYKQKVAVQSTTSLPSSCSGLSYISQWRHSECASYQRDQMVVTFLLLGASFCVVAINIALNILITRMGHWEKHASFDDIQQSIFIRIFLLKFINMGIIVLLVSSNRIINILGFTFDRTALFSVNWYSSTGATITFTLLLNSITPQMVPLMRYLNFKMTWKRDADKQIIQSDLDRLLTGGDFSYALRLAELLSTFFVVLMFSLGIPIMPLIGTFSYLVYYWVEKVLFVHFYRTPPRYNSGLMRRMSSMVPYGVVIHTFMSIWMLGNGLIFISNEAAPYQNYKSYVEGIDKIDIVPKLIQVYTRPLTTILLIVIIYLILKRLGFNILKMLFRVIHLLTCSDARISRLLEKFEDSEMPTVSYSEAILRGMLKGLHSYNIFENPLYQEAFQLSESFARNHNQLYSIARLSTSGTDGDIEEKGIEMILT